MIRIVAILLLVSFILLSSGCATVRRHPRLTGLVVGAAAGTTAALLTRHGTCPTYDGYHGTPPCPIDPPLASSGSLVRHRP